MFFATLALTLCPTLPVQEPSAQPEVDFSGLMPADATVVLRIESLNALRGTMVSLNEFIEPGREFPSTGEMLSNLFQLPIDPRDVDPGRPMYLGLAFPPSGLQMVYVLPAKNVEGLLQSAASMFPHPEARGTWVGMATGPVYQPTASNDILGQLKPGVASIHVEAVPLMGIFGDTLQAGLDQTRQAIQDQMGSVPSPMDMGAIFDLYFDGFELMLTSAESLDVALIDRGGLLTVHGSYRAKEGSALAGLTQSLPLPKTLPVAIPADAPLSYVTVAQADQLFRDFAPLIDNLMRIYPEKLRPQMRGYLEHFPELYKGFGNTAVAFGGFTPAGLEFDYYCDYPDDRNFAEALNTFIAGSGVDAEALGMTFQDPVPIELEGLKATRISMTLDYGPLAETWGENPGSGLDAQTMTDWMNALYGENPTITLAQNKGRLWGHIGSRPAGLVEGVQRLQAGPVLAAPIFASMPGLPATVHPLISYRMDLAAFIAGFQPVVQSAGVDFPPLQGPLNLSVWMGIDGRDWVGGMTFSPREIRAMVGSFVPEEPEVVIQAKPATEPK